MSSSRKTATPPKSSAGSMKSAGKFGGKGTIPAGKKPR